MISEVQSYCIYCKLPDKTHKSCESAVLNFKQPQTKPNHHIKFFSNWDFEHIKPKWIRDAIMFVLRNEKDLYPIDSIHYWGTRFELNVIYYEQIDVICFYRKRTWTDYKNNTLNELLPKEND